MENSNFSLPTRLITVSEAAEILAVSTSYIYSLIKRREISSVKIGRVTRLKADEVEDFIIAHSTPASSKNVDYNGD